MRLIKKILQFLFNESDHNYIDCVNCVHGTSTGNGICSECDGRYYEDKRWVE